MHLLIMLCLALLTLTILLLLELGGDAKAPATLRRAPDTGKPGLARARPWGFGLTGPLAAVRHSQTVQTRPTTAGDHELGKRFDYTLPYQDLTAEP